MVTKTTTSPTKPPLPPDDTSLSSSGKFCQSYYLLTIQFICWSGHQLILRWGWGLTVQSGSKSSSPFLSVMRVDGVHTQGLPIPHYKVFPRQFGSASGPLCCYIHLSDLSNPVRAAFYMPEPTQSILLHDVCDVFQVDLREEGLKRYVFFRLHQTGPSYHGLIIALQLL